MKVEFLEKFSKDLDKINLKQTRESVYSMILKVEKAKSLSEIAGVKKLSGFRTAYRIRIGDYRIGIFADGSRVQFARVVHRKDIYKVFP